MTYYTTIVLKVMLEKCETKEEKQKVMNYIYSIINCK
jgi:hypothetical protein